MNPALTEVLQQGGIWRGTGLAQAEHGVPSGFAALDRVLPGHGWPLGALTEIFHDQTGIGEMSLLMPALAAQTRQGHWVVLVNPPYWLYAPAWSAYGVELSQCLIVRPHSANDVLWTAEQCLRAGVCNLVITWPEYAGHYPEYRQLRRLQAAASTGHAAGVLLCAARFSVDASPAPLRMQVSPASELLYVRILKRRGAPLHEPVPIAVRGKTNSMTSTDTEPEADDARLSVPLAVAAENIARHFL